MFRLIVVCACAWLLSLAPAHANTDPGKLESPRYAIGGGIGFAGLVHVDYQKWVTDNHSIEVGLTPLLLHNVAALAVNQHINMAPSSTSAEHNLVVGATYVGIVNLGGVAAGPGVRVGYELLMRRFGFSLTGGPGIVLGGQFSGDLLPDVRLTLWGVRR